MLVLILLPDNCMMIYRVSVELKESSTVTGMLRELEPAASGCLVLTCGQHLGGFPKRFSTLAALGDGVADHGGFIDDDLFLVWSRTHIPPSLPIQMRI